MLSKFFIERPKFAIVVSLVIILAGAVSISQLAISMYPEITPPQVRVSAFYPGASADVVEATVAAPIEEQVNGVEDMIYMTSSSSNSGRYSLSVTFKVGTDPDIAAVNVQNRVALATPQLPSEVVQRGVSVRKRSSTMLMVATLSSPNGTYDDVFLGNYAGIYIKDTLARVKARVPEGLLAREAARGAVAVYNAERIRRASGRERDRLLEEAHRNLSASMWGSLFTS